MEPVPDTILVPGGQGTQEMLSRIHQDALRILEEVGVRCASTEVQNILVDTGLAAYDDTTGHLHVLSPLVEQALTNTPGRGAYWIPPNSFGVGGTAPFVFDDHSGELVALPWQTWPALPPSWIRPNRLISWHVGCWY